MSTISAADVIDELAAMAGQLDLRLDGVEVTGSSSFEHDLGVDSPGLIDFLAMLEDRHVVRIPDDRLTDVRTIDDVVVLLTDLKRAADDLH